MADHLLQEVDADLRAEQLHRLWLRHRMHLLLLVVALLAATLGSNLWESYRAKRGGALMERFVSAQTLYKNGKFAEAATAFKETGAEAGSGDTRTLALLWQGRAEAAAGQKDAAIATLKTAAEAKPSLWSDLACLRLASLDSAAATCLGNKGESPLMGLRQEWHAAEQWSNGQTDDAIASLEQLATSPDTTEADRVQITQWLATLRARQQPAQ